MKIAQNFVKLSYFEVTFPKTSYLIFLESADPKFAEQMSYLDFFADFVPPHGA